jgi:hypothetical protein
VLEGGRLALAHLHSEREWELGVVEADLLTIILRKLYDRLYEETNYHIIATSM